MSDIVKFNDIAQLLIVITKSFIFFYYVVILILKSILFLMFDEYSYITQFFIV